MARQSRIDIAGLPQHVVQRGNNRVATFVCDDDRRFFRELVAEQATDAAVDVHAYVLMRNHVHLLVTPADAGAVSVMMQGVGRRYVQYFNRRYGRSGTLWEGRFRANVVEADSYLLACQRYIELNPVRAGVVRTPGEHAWSSFHANAMGRPDEIVTPHELYAALGRTPVARRRAYRQLFELELEPGVVTRLRDATRRGDALGSEPFLAELAAAAGRAVGPRDRGGDRRSDRFRRQGAS
ncbi:MAG: transposase [Gammaproteobacteria bacterium]